ncbi:MAG TPA: MFS transporter [Dehalococcoidia bacterium]|nr:MFS transporter [Dehalococcoidia bacterium]
MIFRFSLYGFLKNQRYFEPFLLLALIQMGLSFFEIGLLIAFRELATNVMEIPSGAIADLYGRRKSMILSFAAYIVGFLIFGFASDITPLFGAMFFLAVGDAFRTGTHKAMIFTWLRLQGRSDERTKVYGFTRSWSKIGSAVSALVAAGFVLATDSYTLVFFFAAVPYAMNIVNFLGYPAELEGEKDGNPGPREVLSHLRGAFGNALGLKPLRRLILESMAFEGVFHAVKSYLQPVLVVLAVSLASSYAVGGDLSEVQRSALLVGPVYFVLHLLSSAASRNAHRVADLAGGEDRAARWIWASNTAVFAVTLAAGWWEITGALIVAFVLMHVLQDMWRPVLMARFDSYGDEGEAATVLSIESQAQRFATMLLAPAIGLAIDTTQGNDVGGPFWPIGAVGLAVGLIFFATSVAAPKPSSDPGTEPLVETPVAGS